jgi:hypothetical protein
LLGFLPFFANELLLGFAQFRPRCQ